jgi:predicted RNA polymerase sigma factor
MALMSNVRPPDRETGAFHSALQSAHAVRRLTGQSDWAARAEMLARTGEAAAAEAAYQRAIGLEPESGVRGFLQARRISRR